MALRMIGGMLAGGVVSVVGLAGASLLGEAPAGNMPPAPPLVEAPDSVEPAATQAGDSATPDVSTPVGSLEIQAPVAPDLPEDAAAVGNAASADLADPIDPTPDTDAPRADTDPLDEPAVTAVEGAMEAPDAPTGASADGAPLAQPVDPVLPSPQSLAPQTPDAEADLTVSTTPAAPTVVVEPDVEPSAQAEDAPDTAQDDFFVVDLGPDQPDAPGEDVSEETGADGVQGDEPALADAGAQETTGPRLQLQGGENTLLADRDTGVLVRRPGAADPAAADAAPDTAPDPATPTNALAAFAADPGEIDGQPLMSVVLIDDGSMSAAAAALAGLPFAVTIAIDPALPNAASMMDGYRADGFEVAVLASVPEGALPSDVEVTFESVFATLPESIAVLDIGAGGLQSDRAVTEQAMDILADQGRGFITASQGLNMAGRAAEAAGVPSVMIYRDVDSDDQDARVIRRFLDQAAFRARQESGVVLVGRVRPDTISALILWGTANQDGQVAVVPVSAVLLGE